MAQTPERVLLGIRTAAVMYITLGLGFGIGTAITLDRLRRHGELPMTAMGFRSLARAGSRNPTVQHRAMLLFASFQGQSASQIALLHRASAMATALAHLDTRELLPNIRVPGCWCGVTRTHGHR